MTLRQQERSLATRGGAPNSIANSEEPPMTTLPLSHISVLDLTAHRAGPTARAPARRLGRACHQDRAARRAAGATRWAATATASTSRTCIATRSAMTLNLKSDGRPRDLHEARRQGRCHRRELPLRREASPEGRLRHRGQDQSAHRLWLDRGLRPERPRRRPSRRRPDRPGHGRADVDHRRARPRADARRHPDRRPDLGPAAGAGHHPRALQSRAHRQGPVGPHLADRGADLHARFPGRRAG